MVVKISKWGSLTDGYYIHPYFQTVVSCASHGETQKTTPEVDSIVTMKSNLSMEIKYCCACKREHKLPKRYIKQ